MDPETNNGFRETMSPQVSLKINWWVIRKMRKNISILHNPPIMILRDNKHNFLLQMLGSNEQWQNPIIEFMINIPSIATCGEKHGRNIVVYITWMVLFRRGLP
ncbi:hypothetical protein PanWU01x14_198990 [Parasponia andersonii]|uniref:Uncharacterized protein n=1 Tax=Parasponia andersonii TaxID=3476 RepID=A0A2P5BYL1_PARAD|nr:hypothetical protein PanWU01x14_198990 [Parasponia andersonii]